MILIIFAWIYCFLLALAIGAGSLKLISRVVGTSLNVQYGTFYQFWFGFVILLGILQLLSLFIAINVTAFVIVSLLAGVFAAISIKGVYARWLRLYKSLSSFRGLIFFIAICLLLVAVAYSANREVINGDTFLYHYNGVRWAREYPAVPGLANLHSRLGFNSSFFLFAALTEIGVYEHHSAQVASSFLIAVCAVHWFFVIFNPRELTAKRIFCMMTSLYLFIRMVTQVDMPSLSADFPMAVMTLVFALVLIDRLSSKLILLVPLSALVFTFKLSGMVSVGIGMLVLLGHIFMMRYERNSRRQEIRTILTSFALLCFIVLGFVIRNIIVSGWLLFPLPVGNMHLPWSVPKPFVVDAMAWVESYAKVPGGASPQSIAGLGFFHWLIPWAHNFKRLMEFDMLGASFFILLWAGFHIRVFGKFFYMHLNNFLVVAFSLISILFWLISAPDPRFGSANFFILFAGSIILLYEASPHKAILLNITTMFFIFQIVYRAPSYVFYTKPQLFTFAYTKQRELVKVVGSVSGEKPPLYIYMPATGDACGDSPLPCTPYANGMVQEHRPLKQRKPGDLSKGFLPTEP